MNSIQLFEGKRIRTAWDEEKQEWYFSVIDIVAVLTNQARQRSAAKYWSVLKTQMKKEGNQLTTNCRQLKMTAEDGKSRLTDVVWMHLSKISLKMAIKVERPDLYNTTTVGRARFSVHPS